jgi:prepilin-type N-terminal cleavage/methylation domain-containing protein
VNRRPAFTLVELLVSIALVLVLILGVNQVFKLTSDTVGATNSLSDAIRMNRAMSASLFDDLKHVVLPGTGQSRGAPFFIIQSERVSAFANVRDREKDRNQESDFTSALTVDDAIRSVASQDPNSNADDLTTSEERTAMGRRSHRTDTLSFFSRDLFRRQTGNDGTYAADMTSTEAWVWYGHLRQPGTLALNGTSTANPNADNYMAAARDLGWRPTNGGPTVETAETNTSNYYAEQWYLGRVANLLVSPTPDPATGNLVIPRYDAYGVQRENQTYIGIDPNQLGAKKKPLQPLGRQTQSTLDGVRFVDPESQLSRFDLFGTSINGYAGILKDAILNAPAGANDAPANFWWTGDKGLGYRFAGYPHPARPMTSAGAARTAPCFVPGCTQFAVEYAGDFITQVNDPTSTNFGNATDVKPDGVTDFIVVNGSVRTRWYGFPATSTRATTLATP